MNPALKRKAVRLAIILVVAVAAWATRTYILPAAETTPEPSEAPVVGRVLDDAEIVEAYQDERSGVMVEARGTVTRQLPDDEVGSRHQRFIVRLASGHTTLVAHNIDLAPRVPIDDGSVVTVHGQYEWNAQGGVIHWTHHDPDGRREGGWIEFDGRRYE